MRKDVEMFIDDPIFNSDPTHLWTCIFIMRLNTHTHIYSYVYMNMKNIERYIHKVVNLSYSEQAVMGLGVNWQGQEKMPNIKY